MRAGPPRGATATLEVTVTAAMTARVGGIEIHPVYGTAAFVQHVEEVCRSLLIPHLEDGEDGVGYELSVTHRAPVPVGATIVLTAEVAQVSPRRLICDVMVRRDGTIVGRATFEQRIVDRETFRAELAAGRG